MNALDHNYLRPNPKSILMGNIQYIFDPSDKSMSQSVAKAHKITRIHMTYPTFLILHKNAFKPQYLLPAPKIAGLLPAPKPSPYKDVYFTRYIVGQVIPIQGVSQTCEITRIFTHARNGGVWVTAKHDYGVTTRQLSEIGD